MTEKEDIIERKREGRKIVHHEREVKYMAAIKKIAKQDAIIAALKKVQAKTDAVIASKDAVIASKDAALKNEQNQVQA